MHERAAQGDVAVLSARGEDFGDHVLKETRLHSRRADAADFLLVDEERTCGAARRIGLKHGAKRGVGADAVVLTVAEDEASVKTELARASCGNECQFR